MDVADHDGHIATIRDRLDLRSEPAFSTLLEELLGADDKHDDHERLYSAVWQLVAAESEAGYLFGVCVGLEVASLTMSGGLPGVSQGRKGGRR